ncbi:MAG: response regulator transcription factor [Thermoleophilia bacterium]
MTRALVVDDAPEFVRMVAGLLSREQFEVETAANGAGALELARTFDPDVVVLDIGLPDIDGMEVCRQLRLFSDAYVVMLTGRDGEVDRLVGLTVGADDYVTKPFYPRELVARIRAMLRRPRPGRAAALPAEPARCFGDLEVDIPAHEVRLRGEPVELTRTEFALLDALSENPRVTLSRGQLLERVWGDGWFGDDHVIDVHVSNLRRKLEEDPRKPRYVLTVRGYGYRFGVAA